jgi:hypothetical protein
MARNKNRVTAPQQGTEPSPRWLVKVTTNYNTVELKVPGSCEGEAMSNALRRVYDDPRVWHVLDSGKPVRDVAPAGS